MEMGQFGEMTKLVENYYGQIIFSRGIANNNNYYYVF